MAESIAIPWNRGGRPSAKLVASLTLRYTLMTAVAALMLGPFLWLIYLSLRMHGDTYSWPHISRGDLSFAAYGTVWRDFAVGRAMLNSSLACALGVALSVSVASLAAYPLARFEFPGRGLVSLSLLSTLMMPFQLYMIPLYLETLAIIDAGHRLPGSPDFSLPMVVVPFCANAVGIFLVRQYYANIPKDMEEAARVDGAGELRLWWQIMVPLTRPAVAAWAIFTFVGTWGNFLWPLIILQDEKWRTLPVVIGSLTGGFVDRGAYLAAGSVLAIAPVVVFFLALQRFFLGGMVAGAVKG